MWPLKAKFQPEYPPFPCAHSFSDSYYFNGGYGTPLFLLLCDPPLLIMHEKQKKKETVLDNPVLAKCITKQGL